MTAAHVLYLEDDVAAADLARATLARDGIDIDITLATDRDTFLRRYAQGPVDLVLSDSEVPGFSGGEALRQIRTQSMHVPFVFVSGNGSRERVVDALASGADDFVAKDQLWRLPAVVRRTLDESDRRRREAALDRERRGLALLVDAVKQLSLARSLEDIAAVVRKTARALNGADGATFVLRDGDKCHYFDEDAISPLWKGLRFPAHTCISGWAMQHGEAAAIEDIYADPRIPADAYRPTFVQSLVMVPVRREAPMAAIGNYWATRHAPTQKEIDLIQALADSTAVAMENVGVYQELEARVRARTAELEATNRELEAFSSAVSHDLRSPLGQISGFAGLLQEQLTTQPEHVQNYLQHITRAADRMDGLIRDLLRLSQLTKAEMHILRVDLSAIARDIAGERGEQEPRRRIEWRIAEGLETPGDVGLLRAVMENLLSNALKYSSRREHAVIEVGAEPPVNGERTFFVRDNGAGFDSQHAERLFTPFGRLHSASDFPGTGIGLATVQRIIHRHHGRIRAESTPGAGATFFFTLPVAA